MASPGHGILSSKESMQERSYSSSEDYGKNALKNNMGSEDQALTVHSKKGRRNPHYSKGKDPHHRDSIRRDLSKLRCYTCDERGHFSKDYPKNRVTLIRIRGTK